MKILKIFGIVVAVHIAAFMFVFAIPGCSSKTRRPPTPAETKASPSEPAVTFPGASSGSANSGSVGDSSGPISNGDLNPGLSIAAADSPISPVHPVGGAPARLFNPTRPNTPTASALQTAPVGDIQAVTTYTVAAGESLWTVSRKHGLSVSELATANNLKTDAVLGVGKRLVIPAKTPAAGGSGSGVGGDTITYAVKVGDSLSAIAKRSGTTAGAIRTLNKLNGNVVHVGQKLVLPASTETAAQLATVPSAPSRSNKAPVDGVKHVVKPGETLGQIARKYGVSMREIGAANHISDPQKLPLGKELIIPGATKRATPAPATPPVDPAATPASPVAPANDLVSPVGPGSEPSPISAPSTTEPPVVRVEEGSPVSSAR